MTTVTRSWTPACRHDPCLGGLPDVLEAVLDRGLVIEDYPRVVLARVAPAARPRRATLPWRQYCLRLADEAVLAVGRSLARCRPTLLWAVDEEAIPGAAGERQPGAGEPARAGYRWETGMTELTEERAGGPAPRVGARLAGRAERAEVTRPMLFVYGVVRNEHRLPDPPPLGVGRPARPVWLVHCGPVAAAVSEAPAELVEVGEPEARRHLDVLVELLAGGPVVPLRVGSLAPDERAVHDEVLDPAAYQLRQRLDALEGMVEVHVDADEDEVAAIRAVIAADRGLAAASATARDASPASRLALGERVADEVMRRRRRQAEALLAELRPVAVADAARGPIGGPQDPVLRWAFLVHRGDEPRQRDLAHFDAAVERARATHPELAIRYTGPLPAFHFLDLVQPGDAAGLARHHGRWGW